MFNLLLLLWCFFYVKTFWVLPSFPLLYLLFLLGEKLLPPWTEMIKLIKNLWDVQLSFLKLQTNKKVWKPYERLSASIVYFGCQPDFFLNVKSLSSFMIISFLIPSGKYNL